MTCVWSVDNLVDIMMSLETLATASVVALVIFLETANNAVICVVV
jgi:hypothetical protein